MPRPAAVCQLLGRRAQRRQGKALAGGLGERFGALLTGPADWIVGFLLMLALALALAMPVRAQGVELQAITVRRDDAAVLVDYQLRISLPPAVEDAALRGVPIYFIAQATLWKPRWYWRDDRITRATREWRLSFQPLTSNWRVSQGGFGQSFPTLDEALSTMTRSAGWRIADARDAEPDSRPYVEFNWRLDTTQLPRPMQIGLGGIGGASDWQLGVERSVRLAP